MSVPASSLSLVLRPLTTADLDEVERVETSSYDFPWLRQNFMDCLFLRYHCLLLEYRGVLCTYAIMAVLSDGNAHLLNICVRPDRRRMGFGAYMMNHLMKLARDKGAQCLSLEVRVSNIAGRRMYQRLGFSYLGRKRGYYMSEGGSEDALVLARPVSSATTMADDI